MSVGSYQPPPLHPFVPPPPTVLIAEAPMADALGFLDRKQHIGARTFRHIAASEQCAIKSRYNAIFQCL